MSKIVISTGRQAHYRLPANAFARHGCDVSVYTATPRSRLRGFDPAVRNRWIPAPVAMFSALTHARTPLILDEFDSTLFDRLAAAALQECDLLLGAASSSLSTGKTAQRAGATFVLDRACPDIRVQQQMMVEEARRAGATYRTSSPWFLERQVEEYEQADFILSPSEYSRRSFPEHLRRKIVLAPLYGRSKGPLRAPKIKSSTFTLGVVGGHPLRKGYLYLLQAWKELALPNAQIKMRCSSEIYKYPVIEQLLASLPNVHSISYLNEMSGFYGECDAFILPSVDDGFGMALLEALSCGVPCIATRNCGAAELLTPERDFLLIDAFSVEQIKNAVLRLYQSHPLREQLAANGAVAVDSMQGANSPLPYEAGLEALIAEMIRPG